MNKFDPKFPFYDDDSDYNTNANSYYKDLGRKNKLIKLLAKRIWDYDEELAKRFDAWDKNLEKFPENVEILLQQWLSDGTLDHIINVELMSWKAEIFVSPFEPTYPTQMTYWYKDVGDSGLETGQKVFNTNVAVSENEPEDESKNV